MSAITPNPDQFKALAAAAANDDGPVVMLNLLKFKSGGGAREYGKYGDAAGAMVKALGGRMLYIGRADQVLIGDEATNDWDAIALVEYPSRQAFIDMVSKREYRDAHEHREGGLERTVLIATVQQSASGS